MENKIYTEIYTVNFQFTQEIANLHSNLPIFRVTSENLHRPKKICTGAARGKFEVWRVLPYILYLRPYVIVFLMKFLILNKF